MQNREVAPNEQAADGRSDAEALARRAAARDPQAWGEIFEEHYHAVFGFVRFRLSGADEAEDIAAQTFEVAYSRVDSFDYRGVPIQGWLIGIARNLVRDHIKKRMRRGYQEELVETMTPPVPDATPAVDIRSDLLGVMKALTSDQQTVLTLRFLLDKSVAQTAAQMDRSEDAVKNLQRRALAAMQRGLAGTVYAEARGA